MAEAAPRLGGLATPRRVPLEPLRRRAHAQPEAPPARTWVRLLTFSALGLYGSLRWATLVAPAATGRMLLLLALAIVTAGVLGRLAERGGARRTLAALGVVVPVVLVFPLSGVPLALVVHLHAGGIADGIGQGLTALPRVIVPDAGLNAWVRTLIVLGGGMLLLDAGIVLAFVPAALGDLRRAGAAFPLIALAIVPSALEVRHAAYLQGLLLFVLVAAFVWGERLGRREVLPAAVIAGLAGMVGVLLAPGLDTHRPLFNYQGFANAFSPAGTETFDWFQGYGPYSWPTTGKRVLGVKAAHREFWKTQNLDRFDGTGWAEATQDISGTGDMPPPTPAPSPAALATWTQSLRVTIATMATSEIVASGVAQEPENVPGGVAAGPSPGTWIANHQLGPGDAYTVKVYAPNPSGAELAAAGASYPPPLDYYRQMFVPARGSSNVPGSIVFPAFGSAVSSASASYVSWSLAVSPYGPAYRLAQHLEAGAATPYAFVERVLRYLQHGYTYDTNAPNTAYPIETFLFKDRYGYCQHFAGAMALLLRMGGVPARVAVGFTPGSFNSTTGEWDVQDSQAHAWVEAWFPTYGWVAFDPTPSATASPHLASTAGAAQLQTPNLAGKLRASGGGSGAGRRAHRRSGLPIALIVAIALVLGLGGGAFAVRRRRRGKGPPSSDELLDELERALRRSSLTLAPATTLAQLDRRFRRSAGAAQYVRALALARYADGAERPTAVQRRALRAQLALGGGAFRRLRALWALPPRW